MHSSISIAKEYVIVFVCFRVIFDVNEQVSVFAPRRYLKNTNRSRVFSRVVTPYHVEARTDVRNDPYATMGTFRGEFGGNTHHRTAGYFDGTVPPTVPAHVRVSNDQRREHERVA